MKRIGRLIISLFLICTLLSGCFGGDDSSHTSKKNPFVKELYSFTQRQIVMLNESYISKDTLDPEGNDIWRIFGEKYIINKYLDFVPKYNRMRTQISYGSTFKYMVKNAVVHLKRAKLMFKLENPCPDVEKLPTLAEHYVKEITLVGIEKEKRLYICGYFSEPVSELSYDRIYAYLKEDSRFSGDLYSENLLKASGVEECSFASLGKDASNSIVIKDGIIGCIIGCITGRDDKKPSFTVKIIDTNLKKTIFSQKMDGQKLDDFYREGDRLVVEMSKTALDISYPRHIKKIDLQGKVEDVIDEQHTKNPLGGEDFFRRYILADGNTLTSRDGSIYYKDSKTGKETALLVARKYSNSEDYAEYYIAEIINSSVFMYYRRPYPTALDNEFGYYNIKTFQKYTLPSEAYAFYTYGNCIYSRQSNNSGDTQAIYVTDIATNVTKKVFETPSD